MIESLDANATADGRSREPDSSTKRRIPAVSIALLLVIGIALDRWLGISFAAWFVVGAMAFGFWIAGFIFGSSRAAVVMLLLTCVSIGGMRHHLFWSTAAEYDIANFVDRAPRLIRLKGKIATTPYIVSPVEHAHLTIPQTDRSICAIDCQSLFIDEQQRRVAGTARLEVSGNLRLVQIGDVVEVVGWISTPGIPRNPGEFDFREYLRREGMRTIVRTNHEDAVNVVRKGSAWSLARIRSNIRADSEAMFTRLLSRRTAPIASALLLGSRTRMPNEIRKHFAESGTIHLLAISGLHVGILAVFLMACCRLMNVSNRIVAIVLVCGVLWFLMITDSRPPVVRASILVFLYAVALLQSRPVSAANSLAVAAIIVLAMNPSDLFDAGAQLSFVAVAAILWSSRYTMASADNIPVLPDESAFGRFKSRMMPAARSIKSSYLMTMAIWLFTAPLVLWSFNLVAPIGIVLNVVLIPLVAVALWSGYGLLISGLLMPPLAIVFAFVFDGLLSLLLWIVDAAAQIDMGHRYVAAPPLWWIVGCYVLIATIVCIRSVRLSRHWGCRGLCLWMILGFGIGLLPSKSSNLRCTFLSVGHGCSVLLQMPNGRTLLYDAGSINSPSRAANIVQNALWQNGATGIDAVVVSHADIDHFNAVPALIEFVPVRAVMTTQTFLDMSQAGVVEVCDAANEKQIPISLLFSGDKISLDNRVSIRVIHPKHGFRSESDNANSLVLEIEYAGRRILLTGDLEEDGLRTLLDQDPTEYDVILSPHHGSRAANPVSLADWANPKIVVASGGKDTPLSTLRQRYGTDVLSTHTHGAITIEVTPSGLMNHKSHLRPIDR